MPIKKPNLQEPLPFQSSKITSQSSMQNSFIFHHPAFSYKDPYNAHRQSLLLLQLFFTSLFSIPTCSQNYAYNSYQHPFPLYRSYLVHPYLFMQLSLQSQPKISSSYLSHSTDSYCVKVPVSERVLWGLTLPWRMGRDNSSQNQLFFIAQTLNILSVLQVKILLINIVAIRMGRHSLSHPPPY